jgi:hypothetical protein
MDENLKDKDILLVKKDDSKELRAVAGLDKKGGLETVSPKQENQSKFIAFDRNGNALENFIENFARQFKNPSRFQFFNAPADRVEETANNLQKAAQDPEKSENKEFLDMHKVEMPEIKRKYAISSEQVDWTKMMQFGVSEDRLEKNGEIDKLLNYQKTDLMPVYMKVNGITVGSDARISLHKQEDGTFAPNVHFIRKSPDLRSYFGVEFSEEDKKTLLSTGNLGRVVEAEYRQGIKTPVLLSIDRQTNELVAYRKDLVKAPETYMGVTLSEEQKETLGRGEKIHLEGLVSKKGTTYNCDVQFNADKRYFEPVFNKERRQKQEWDGETPKTFRKQELSAEQRDSLREGKTVYVDGLVDKKGKGYAGYITLNKENGKVGFMFPNDYKTALSEGKVVPDDRHKTQVAVNNEGKTNEATKNLKMSLDKGQTQPTEKQQNQQKEAKPKKSKSMKM